MDKKTIIGLLLIFFVFIGYSVYTSHNAKKAREQQIEQEMKQQAKKKAADKKTAQLSDTIAKDTTALEDNAESATAAATTAPAQKKNTNYFSFADTTQTNDFVVRTNKAEYRFSRYGGYLKSVKLHDIYKYAPKGEKKKELYMHETGHHKMALTLHTSDSLRSFVSTENCYFRAEKDTVDVKSNTGHLRLYLHPYKLADTTTAANSVIDSEAYILFDYTFNADDYMLDFDVKFQNMSPYIAKQSPTNIKWNSSLFTAEKNIEAERRLTTLYYMDNGGKVKNLDEIKSESKDVTTTMKWVSFKQQFFTSILVAKKDNFKKGELKVDVNNQGEGDPLLKTMSSNLGFEVKDYDKGNFAMQMYYGPNQYKLLKKYQNEQGESMGFERLIPLGWGFFLLQWINRGVVIPIFNWLDAYGLNYGIIILILSIFIKIVIFPMAYKTYLSSAKMRVLKPQIDEINEKYPKPEDAMKKQQATMNLYKKAGVSPMGGCLPMLIQMPILIAMFRFFPAAYELRQQSFLWAEDLSTYDSILDLGFSIPFYGDHVSLFTLLMTAATLVYTWLNNRMMMATNGDQMKMMKWMMYLMPILFLPMFNSFSSALLYYYLLINLITFFQMWIFRITINEEKLLKKMQTNMVKPVKKSRWQERMEQMIKQQQQLQQKKK